MVRRWTIHARIALSLLAVAASNGCVVPPAPPANGSRTDNAATNAAHAGDRNANTGPTPTNSTSSGPEPASNAAPRPTDGAGPSDAPSTASDLSPGLHTLSFTRPGAEQPVNYLLFLPVNTRPGTQLPVLFYLHGKSLSGDDPQMLMKYGPPKIVSRDPAFPFILVAPQCRAGQRWTDVATLDALLGDVLSRYPADPDRVYLTGYSMGAGGAWRFGGARPERFAAVAALAGVEESGSAKGLARVPVWAFHGTDDAEVPASASQAMVDAIRAAGGDAKLELLSGRGHDILDVYGRKDLYSWFLEHRRGG